MEREKERERERETGQKGWTVASVLPHLHTTLCLLVERERERCLSMSVVWCGVDMDP